MIPGTNTLLFSFIVNWHKSITCFSIWVFTIGSVWCWRVDHTARNCVSEGQWRFDGTSFTIWSHLGWYITSELRCVFEMSVCYLLYRNVYQYLLSHILMIDNDNFLNFCKIALTWKYFKSRVTCIVVTKVREWWFCFLQTHLTFGKEFTQAVELKQVAQQDAEKARFLVEKVMIMSISITTFFEEYLRWITSFATLCLCTQIY